MVLREPVDIIVSDVTMPEMDGLEFCQLIRQRPEHVDIPFIFLTAHGGAGERIRGLRSGADEYMVKPVNAADLVARVKILHDHPAKALREHFEGEPPRGRRVRNPPAVRTVAKAGVLYVDAPAGKGELALADGSLVNAVWNDLAGEDAAFQMVALEEGEFRFLPKAVPSGNVVQPISFMLMEMARLTDELATVEGHIPASGVPLIVRGSFDGEDTDAQSVHKAIVEGCANLAAVQRALRG